MSHTFCLVSDFNRTLFLKLHSPFNYCMSWVCKMIKSGTLLGPHQNQNIVVYTFPNFGKEGERVFICYCPEILGPAKQTDQTICVIKDASVAFFLFFFEWRHHNEKS